MSRPQVALIPDYNPETMLYDEAADDGAGFDDGDLPFVDDAYEPMLYADDMDDYEPPDFYGEL